MAVAFRGTRADLVRLIRELAAAVGGDSPDSHGIARPVLTRGGVALLSKVQGAFLQKARGGTGDDGVTWKPLDRKTVAARRGTRAELRASGAGGRRTRGLLTPAEDKLWRAIYASTLAQFRARGVGGAEALAAQRAWGVLKSRGAKTRLAVLGSRNVEIGRDTGALLRSLTPGSEDSPARPSGQVLEVEPGRIAVGSSVPHASHFHARRPLWPETLPEAWWDAVANAVARGLMRAIADAVARG